MNPSRSPSEARAQKAGPRRAGVGAVLGVALAAACAPADASRPDLLLVSLDTLRADHLSCYGFEHETTPFLDRMAQQGVRFESAMAAASNTAPSHMSLLTGLDPFAHGIRPASANDEEVRVLSPRNPTLAELLGGAGYQTLGLADNGNVMSLMGFGRGFDVWENVRTTLPQKLTMLAARLREVDPDVPLFTFFHTYEIHAPYLPPPPFHGRYTDAAYDGEFRERYDELIGLPEGEAWRKKGRFLREFEGMDDADVEFLAGLYAEGIAYTDSLMERMWRIWGQRRDRANTLLVVVSDHGEGFMEHGNLGHKYSLFHELLHVPLILHGPGLGPLVVKADVSLTDLVPTLLDYLDLPGPSMQGTSFLSLARGDAAAARPVFSQLNARKGPHDSILHGDSHLLRWPRDDGQRFDLYRRSSDRREADDLADDEPQRVAELVELLDERQALGDAHQRRAPSLTAAELTELDRETLEALGYVE